MNGESLYRETEYLRAFPAASDVFANRVQEHSAFLLPVATLSLSYLSKEWSGSYPFIIPIEPCGGWGCLGQRSLPHHNYLCRPNWLAYKISGDKCELACDFDYFHKQFYIKNPPTDIHKDEMLELPQHYDVIRKKFDRHAEFFRKHGWLIQDPDRWQGDPSEIPDLQRPLVYDVGGVSYGGNWCGTSDFPCSTYPDQFEDRGKIYECPRVLPRTADGRDFHYIGQVEMWNFIGDTNGVLVLFYDPQDQIALTTIDWT